MARKKKQNRRAHGEGSLYQRESDGLWVGVVDLGHDSDGKRIRKTVSAQTQAACLEKLAALRERLRDRKATGSSRSFGSWTDEWLADYAHQVKRRTYEIAETELRLHILPRIGDILLKDITAAHVRKLQSALADSHSARTALGARNRVRMILEAAKSEGMLAENVADGVRRVRQEKREMLIWGSGEIKRFLSANRGKRDFPLFYFYLATGLRKSEALALKWEDVDLARGFFRVRGTVTWERSRPKLSDVTKTAAGRREVPLNASLRSMLQQQQRLLEKERLTPGWRDLELVFPNRLGGINENPERSWERFKRAANVPDIRIHDLRHTFVSMCIERGMNVVRLSKLIGHSDLGFTLKVYAHLFERAEGFSLPELEDDLLA